METRHCEDCAMWIAGWSGGRCAAGHRPRFYMPHNELDLNWGWKRKCADFVLTSERGQMNALQLARHDAGENISTFGGCGETLDD